MPSFMVAGAIACGVSREGGQSVSKSRKGQGSAPVAYVRTVGEKETAQTPGQVFNDHHHTTNRSTLMSKSTIMDGFRRLVTSNALISPIGPSLSVLKARGGPEWPDLVVQFRELGKTCYSKSYPFQTLNHHHFVRLPMTRSAVGTAV